MRFITIILSLLVFATMANAGEETPKEEPKLTPATQRAVDAFDRDIAKAKADFDEAVQKAKDKMGVALEREMEAVMRKYDLDGATAIKALQEKLAARTGLEQTDILGKPIEKSADKPAQGTFHIKADELSQVYINGKKVMDTTSHRQVFKKEVTLEPGDVLVISYTNKGGGGGVTAGYVHVKGVGYSTQSAKWRVIKTDDPASVSAEDVKNGTKVVAASLNEDDRNDIKTATKLNAETLEASANAVGTFVLATVVGERDFQRIK